MDNPISPKARGWIYIAGIIIGGLCLIAITVLEVTDLAKYSPIVASISAATGTVVAALARANLTSEPTESQD